MSLSILSRLLTCVTLVNEHNFNRVARCCLHLGGQLSDLRPLLLIGWRDQHCEQMPKRINGDMDFASLSTFVAIITRS